MCILWSQSKYSLPTVDENLSVKRKKEKSDFGYSYFFCFPDLPSPPVVIVVGKTVSLLKRNITPRSSATNIIRQYITETNSALQLSPLDI